MQIDKDEDVNEVGSTSSSGSHYFSMIAMVKYIFMFCTIFEEQ